MKLGERIKEKRQAEGISQERLARRADISLNVLNRIETGAVTNPHFATVIALADALGVTVGELLEEESPKAEAPSPSKAKRERRRGARFEQLSPEERRRLQEQVDAMWEALELDIPKKLRELQEELEIVRSVVVEHPALAKRREAEQSINKVERRLHELEEDLRFGLAG